MKSPLIRLLAAAALVVAAPLAAQESPRRWTLAGGPGVYRVDDLAGTPLIPVGQLTRDFGNRGIFALQAGWINNAGFYSLTALTLDLGLGVRTRPGRLEGAILAGPSGMLGGDSDGTPYVGAAVHGTGLATWWLSERVGLTAGATARIWVSTGNSRFSPSGFGGLRIRL